ncbi:MAG: Kelch repeat-containing protein, partial [Planctomycetota bacterium]
MLEEEFETETLLDVNEFDSQTPTFVDRQLLPATMLPSDGVVVDGRLFTFGEGTTDALIYSPVTEEWTTLPDLPEARVGARVVSEGTRVYIVTGTRPDGAPIRFLDHLDVAAGSPAWSRTEIDGGIDALSEAAVTVHAGSLFVFGGRDETGTITGDGYSFVLASATSATPLFAALPDVLPQARFLPAAFVAPDPQTSDFIIHITGGLSATGVGLTSEVLFDPALKTSSLAPDPVPNARTDPQIIEGNGEFFALWSRRIGFGRDDRVDVYDVATGTWAQTTSAPRTLQMTTAAFVD